jgi:hypothetical protein
MSHFAELDSTNTVIRVLVCDNNDPNGDEGYQWLIDNLGGTWIKTSYNSTIRYNFAGIGYTYDPIDDAFIPAMPECGHDTLLLNELKRWECADCEAIALQSRTTA